MNRRRAALAGAALLFLCLAVVAACGGGSKSSPTPTFSPTPTPTPSPTPSPSPTPHIEPEASRDLLDLAKRFRGFAQDGPAQARTSPYGYQVGDTADFKLIGSTDTPSQYAVHATLRAISDHAYFFVNEDATFNQPDVDQEAAAFDQTVWPTITGAFGEPWTPGVDGDPRITILFAPLQGAGGYVSAEDEYPNAAVPVGNEREMIYLDQGYLGQPGTGFNSVAAHELQHLIHFNGDQSEDAWVNEGLSQVAWEMAGGDTGEAQGFLEKPDTQLNFWPVLGDTIIHYGESELFFDYLLDHYGGRNNARQLVDEQGNGIDGVNAYLAQYGKTFDDVFADFAVANLLNAGSGPYGYPSFQGRVSSIDQVTTTAGGDTVSQYGTDYLGISAGAGETFHFQGSASVSIGIPATDGAFWWSGRMDGMDSTLTREVDLTGTASATLNFDTWYDCENGWDFSYVAASTDGGATWIALPGAHTTNDDPVGDSYGPSYTGASNGWVREQTDLSAYAGKKIMIRFETVNDDSANLEGFAVDNISIPQIGYTDNADSGDGWTANGFSQVTAPMQQKFIVQVIGPDGSVRRVDLGADNSADIELTGDVTVAVSGATPNTTETASYTWTLGTTI